MYRQLHFMLTERLHVVVLWVLAFNIALLGVRITPFIF